MMNSDPVPGDCQPSNEAKNDFGRDYACRLLSSTSTITIYYYYSAQ